MEAKEARNKKIEELEYFFQFLSNTKIEKRNEIFDKYRMYLEEAMRTREPAKEAFNEMLNDFRDAGKNECFLFVRKDYKENERMVVRLTHFMESMQLDEMYTPLDRFLQYLFSFDDNTIKEYLVKTLKTLDSFLKTIYPQEPDPMQCLLHRDLREADLLDWDERDYYVTTTGVEDPKLGAPPNPDDLYVRVRAFKSLEQVFIKVKLYTPVGGASNFGIPDSSIRLVVSRSN